MKDKKTHFRAITTNGARRGISLEPVFWTVLEEIAQEEHLTNGTLVAQIAEEAGKDSKNLSSEIRSFLMRRIAKERARFRTFLSLRAVNRLVQACPAPCFILTIDKRILSYNKAFVGFLQLRFATIETVDFLRSLTLTLDVPLEESIAKLNDSSSTSVLCGFSIGMSGKRVRGQLSLVYMEIDGTPSVIAYIVE